MSKILVFLAAAWSLLENQPVFVAILTSVGAVATYYGFNIPVPLILASVTAIMVSLGVSGWKATAQVAQETQLKLALISQQGAARLDTIHAQYLELKGKKSSRPQSGRVRVRLMFALSLAGAPALAFASCSTVTPGGKCEVNAVEQVVTTNGSADVTIVADIVSSIATGGATLPALLLQLEATFGPQTVACATELADDIATALEKLLAPAPSTTPTVTAASTPPPPIRSGLVVLHGEMDKRHHKHR